MRTFLRLSILAFGLSLLILSPSNSYAQEGGSEVIETDEQMVDTAEVKSINPVSGGEENSPVQSGDGPLYPTVIDNTVNITDPSLHDVTLLGLSIARFLVGIIGGVVILMLCYGGFSYISGYMQGSEDGANAGKTIITHAVIGLVLVLTSYLIVTMFQSTLTSKNFVEEGGDSSQQGIKIQLTSTGGYDQPTTQMVQSENTDNSNQASTEYNITQKGTRAGIVSFIKSKYGPNNGRLPEDKLKSIGGGHRLIPEAADQWLAFANFMKSQGKNYTVGSSYRRLQDQKVCGKCAPPGTSIHGWGAAIDISQLYTGKDYSHTSVAYKKAVETIYKSESYKWFTENIAKYGFYNPEGLRNNWQDPKWYKEGAPGLDEPWHFEYYGGGTGNTALAKVESGACTNTVAIKNDFQKLAQAQFLNNTEYSCSLEDRDPILSMEEAINNFDPEKENFEVEQEIESPDLEEISENPEENSSAINISDPFLNNEGSYTDVSDPACSLASTDWTWNKLMAYMKADITSNCNSKDKKPKKTTQDTKKNLPNAGKFQGKQDVADSKLSPQMKAMLDTIAFKEGTSDYGNNGYNVTYALKRFDGINDHPRAVICAGKYCSSAAGRYQFLSTTYDDLKNKLGIKDFSPETQDYLTVFTLRVAGVEKLIQDGKIENVLSKDKKLGYIWASFPYSPYGQQKADNKLLVKEMSTFFRNRVYYYEKKESQLYKFNDWAVRDNTYVYVPGSQKFNTEIIFKNGKKELQQASNNNEETPSIFLVGHSYGKLLCDNHFNKSNSRYRTKCSAGVGENIKKAVSRVKDEKSIFDLMIIFTGVNDYKNSSKQIKDEIKKLWTESKGKAKKFIFIDTIRYMKDAQATKFSDNYLNIVKQAKDEVDKKMFVVYINPNDYNNVLRDTLGDIPPSRQKYIFDFSRLHQENDSLMVGYIYDKINKAISDKNIKNGNTY